MNTIRSAVAAAFGRAGFTARPRTEWQVGDDLHTAYARKIGVPVATRPGRHPDTVPHPVNRAARRRAQTREDVLASYSRRPVRRAEARAVAAGDA